jgi:transposase
MKGWKMYSRIQALKEQGFSIRQVSRLIRVSRNTIKKYWEMSPAAYAARYTAVNRLSALSAYETIVLKWLESYPCMTASQVRDWLEERYSIDASERTVRRFVSKLREEHGITRWSEPVREYEAVEELPKGWQAQLDFGEKKVRDAYSSRYIKLYFVVVSLSFSRYKWGIFQERPYTAKNLVRALYGCFAYYGGMPKELVYDQDSILVVSENKGDIIHTEAFAAFLSETKVKTRVCRKNDPETKGKIEATVKFVKRNFMENRLYTGIEQWNYAFEEWLDRTGNGKPHGTTKRKPAELFLEEQEHLLPLIGGYVEETPRGIERCVRGDNTVMYLSNRYSVPLGTYGKHKTVMLDVDGETLRITDVCGDEITAHRISREKGKLIKQEAHGRDRRGSIQDRLTQAISLLGEEFRDYLTVLCARKQRYTKEQLSAVVKACREYGRERVLAAMQYCEEWELYSANDLQDAMLAIEPLEPVVQSEYLPVDDERYHIAVQKRALAIYTQVAAESGAIQ